GKPFMMDKKRCPWLKRGVHEERLLWMEEEASMDGRRGVQDRKRSLWIRRVVHGWRGVHEERLSWI
ncbi:unnamed protein product, partial [Nesidiocoris tenuis]